MVMIVQKKPIKVRALQWHEGSEHQMKEFAGDNVSVHGNKLVAHTLEGNMEANEGDWIIQGIEGEFYPCKQSIFDGSYDIINYESEKPHGIIEGTTEQGELDFDSEES